MMIIMMMTASENNEHDGAAYVDEVTDGDE